MHKLLLLIEINQNRIFEMSLVEFYEAVARMAEKKSLSPFGSEVYILI